MNTPETMTYPTFDDLTPPDEVVREWRVSAAQNYRDKAIGIATYAARWGAEQAAERLKGQWPTPITDRLPTEADGDDNGCVQFLCRNGWWDASVWHIVANHGWPWHHTPRWQPPAPPTHPADVLAAIIREVDGDHKLGAAALAEAVLAHPDFRRALEADS